MTSVVCIFALLFTTRQPQLIKPAKDCYPNKTNSMTTTNGALHTAQLACLASITVLAFKLASKDAISLLLEEIPSLKDKSTNAMAMVDSMAQEIVIPLVVVASIILWIDIFIDYILFILLMRVAKTPLVWALGTRTMIYQQ